MRGLEYKRMQRHRAICLISYRGLAMPQRMHRSNIRSSILPMPSMPSSTSTIRLPCRCLSRACLSCTLDSALPILTATARYYHSRSVISPEDPTLLEDGA